MVESVIVRDEFYKRSVTGSMLIYLAKNYDYHLWERRGENFEIWTYSKGILVNFQMLASDIERQVFKPNDLVKYIVDPEE